MNESDLSKLRKLPEDWWRYVRASQTLVEWFRRYIVGLIIRIRMTESAKTMIFTGFLLYYEDLLMWATAGHIIDDLLALQGDATIEVQPARWADCCNITGAESVLFDFSRLKMFSATSVGVDFGVAVLEGLDAKALMANRNVEIMTEQGWKNLEAAKPEGFYLIGYPDDWNTSIVDENAREIGFKADLACIPVEPLEYRGPDRDNKFWDIPDLFYGRMVFFVDRDVPFLNSAVGMSGGPLLSLERSDEGIVYRLFGVQRASDKTNRENISVEPIGRILQIMQP
jgi:hypothetical protein